MQDLEKYLNTARKAELDNVPFDKDGIGSMLQKHREAGSQNFFKKIISKYGKLKMYSIMSIITASMLFISSMMLDSSDSTPTVKAKKIQITIGNDTTNIENYNSDEHDLVDMAKNNSVKPEVESTKDTTKKEVPEYGFIIRGDRVEKPLFPSNHSLTVSEASDLIDEYLKTHSFKDTMITFYETVSDFKISDDKIRWQHLKFEPKAWRINTRYNFRIQRRFDKEGNNFPAMTYISYYPETPTLVRLLGDMEKDITEYCDIKQLRNLGICDLKDYFPLLDTLLGNIPMNIENRSELLKEVAMYGQVSRAILDNPFKGFKYKDKGITLDRATLENLGLVIEENMIKFPNDEVFIDSSMIKYNDYIYSMHFKDEYKPEYINRNLYVTKDDIYQWILVEGIAPKNTNYIKVIHWDSPDSADYNKKDPDNRTCYHGYYYYKAAAKNTNRISPILKSIDMSELSQLRYLYDSDNEELNKIYYLSYNAMKKRDELNDYLEDKEAQKDTELESQLRLASTQSDIVAKNAIRNLQYTKLIPVDVPVPYGVQSEEELENDDFSSVTLWYYPDEKFLDALPDEIRNKVVKEMNLLESVVAGELPASDACEALDGEESLLGLCNLADMAIQNLNAAPNPTDGNCEISYSLTEERYTKMMLLDNSGRYVEDISDWESRSRGDYRFYIDISSLPKGNYNIAVFTNKNEKMMFKLMKK